MTDEDEALPHVLEFLASNLEDNGSYDLGLVAALRDAARRIRELSAEVETLKRQEVNDGK